MWPCQESNLNLELRKLLYYPLYYKAIFIPLIQLVKNASAKLLYFVGIKKQEYKGNNSLAILHRKNKEALNTML